MPRILIAGCGYVGQSAADLFHDAGWEVEAWTASSESVAKLSDKPYPVVAVDIADADRIAARPKNFDAVVHCASTRGGDAALYRSVYLKGAGNLLQRFDRAAIVFTSSTSVYAQVKGELVTEESIAAPRHETGKVLRETEELVLSRGGIIARLAGIYGPGRSALLKKFLSGEASIDPQNDRFVNQVHRDDIAAALFLLIDQRAGVAQIYNVVDDEPTWQSECYRWLAVKLNRPIPPLGKSEPGRKRGVSNKRVSNAKLRRLGWTPGYPSFSEAMERSILPSFELPKS
jgi:nucleoside-diphosphate-sugar epimerase